MGVTGEEAGAVGEVVGVAAAGVLGVQGRVVAVTAAWGVEVRVQTAGPLAAGGPAWRGTGRAGSGTGAEGPMGAVRGTGRAGAVGAPSGEVVAGMVWTALRTPAGLWGVKDVQRGRGSRTVKGSSGVSTWG